MAAIAVGSREFVVALVVVAGAVCCRAPEPSTPPVPPCKAGYQTFQAVAGRGCVSDAYVEFILCVTSFSQNEYTTATSDTSKTKVVASVGAPAVGSISTTVETERQLATKVIAIFSKGDDPKSIAVAEMIRTKCSSSLDRLGVQASEKFASEWVQCFPTTSAVPDVPAAGALVTHCEKAEAERARKCAGNFDENCSKSKRCTESAIKILKELATSDSIAATQTSDIRKQSWDYFLRRKAECVDYVDAGGIWAF